LLGSVTWTAEPTIAGGTTCSGKAMTKPEPAVAVPAGTNTATNPVTCWVGVLMVLTLTPELELIATLLGAELLLAEAAELLAAKTVKVGGA